MDQNQSRLDQNPDDLIKIVQNPLKKHQPLMGILFRRQIGIG